MIQVLLQRFAHMLHFPPASLRLVILLAAVLAYGAAGFLFFELPANPDLSWADGLWYTVVTMTTVGYGDFFPKSLGGRFLVGYPVMLFGIGMLGYALSLTATALLTYQTKAAKGMASVELKGHLVIFNFPGLAKVVRLLEELCLDPQFDKHRGIVLVDPDLESLPAELAQMGVRFVRGNPTRDDTLTRAALDHARHAIVLSKIADDPASDNLNLAITLAIEARTHGVNTVVECVDPAAEELLKKAGCDKFVCANRFDAFFISQELVNPGIQELVEDLLSARAGQQLYFVPVSRSQTFARAAAACQAKGHLAIGAKTAGRIRLNLAGDLEVAAGDALITIGPQRLFQV